MLVSQIESIDSNRIHLDILEELEATNQKNRLRDILAQQYGFRFQNLTIDADNRSPSALEHMRAMTFHTSYSMNDFMKYHDTEFIICCFRYLLKRDPDPAALHHYVHLLRNGCYDRVLILARVYFSGESRQKGIKVRGLLPVIPLHALYFIPILGYLVQLVVILLSLPLQARRQDRALNAQITELKSIIEQDHHNTPAQIANLLSKNNDTLLDGLGKILMTIHESNLDQSQQHEKDD